MKTDVCDLNIEGMDVSESTDEDMTGSTTSDNCHDIPTILYACNVHESVYTSENQRRAFEDLFCGIGPAQFIYLPSFRRVRINYETAQQATEARISLDQICFCGQSIGLYFGQLASSDNTSTSLVPPVNEKTFLISPPASPPVGWQSKEESEPVFNFDLISALVELTPGESHELHRATSSTPSVVVHICEDHTDAQGNKIAQNKIQQTRRPGA
uniref:Calcipressin-1-like n=1 Tax=Phallusia mammillata TaxID=59560 RepID=A0A6F9DQN4_9ASCI|nr:calcipressin-1-like [Phallusia mammillata]